MRQIQTIALLLIFSLACNTIQQVIAPRTATPAPPLTTQPNASGMAQLLAEQGQPCPADIASQFTCVHLNVPLDHADPANSPTITVVFGVRPATGTRRGFFVTATGGPGTAGLYSADSYTDGMPPQIPEHFDIVFFDQRGVGLSGQVYCPKAVTPYYDLDTDPRTSTGEQVLNSAAQQLANDCESEQANDLKAQPANYLDYLGTRQAVEDLEAFRQLTGDDKFYLYGESYGTQFAQTYAAAHPDHLSGLILDGTVDLTLSGPDYLREQTQAFNDVLLLTLQACNADSACAADMGTEAVTVYDSLATELTAAPATFGYPLTDGSTADRTFTFSDLEFTVVSQLYSEAGRTDLLKALAAAHRNDWQLLAELHYDALSLDYDTLTPQPDPSYSDALYYTVECNDYAHYSGSPAEQAQTYLKDGDQVEGSIPRLDSVFYGDLPCAYWPVRPDADSRPGPLVIPGVPTLVLNALADPATPYTNGVRVFKRLADGYLITKEGGPHVIFGWGNECPDLIVADFLVESKMPDQRETTCPGTVIAPYPTP